MSVSLSDLKTGLSKLGLTKNLVIAHASLKAFGLIDGGAEAMLNALLDSTRGIIMPTFTYKSMLNPEVGPPQNGITYGSEADLNKLAEAYHPDMPVDKLMGVLPEILRKHPKAKRSLHPIQSFAGIRADGIIGSQRMYDPLAPIGSLADQDGWALLLGVDHTVNTSIHYAEKLAGRLQFIRWALVQDRVVECPGFPGDSDGFNVIAPALEKHTRRVKIGNATVQAIHLKSLFKVVVDLIKENPFALLCQRPDCERCTAVRWS
ncbi:AAC(3) family N-acetyltransferase [Candidatus Villigracilis saccharophilus]|uniref:AAC(3) family N-acetyltransferase n=1 Tax=Candidatus Villigracilis saccharophilus TaxID=3140684 RepID=UPI0031349D54|nr:AAC(3) family N-acetyltransferase [Anaerolineales bacterium]